MNSTSSRHFGLLTSLILLLSTSALAQDSLSSEQPRKYTSIGFQASFVSGIGISVGYNQESNFRFRVTAGLATADQITYFSFGAEYEIELTKHKPYRVFIGPGIGTRGQSDGDTHTAIGLGTGFEISPTGNSLFENVSVGAEIYYPTYFFLTKDIWFGGGFFISYNF